jgi:hypothetical protein
VESKNLVYVEDVAGLGKIGFEASVPEVYWRGNAKHCTWQREHLGYLPKMCRIRSNSTYYLIGIINVPILHDPFLVLQPLFQLIQTILYTKVMKRQTLCHSASSKPSRVSPATPIHPGLPRVSPASSASAISTSTNDPLVRRLCS